MTHHQACCCGPSGPDCTACRSVGSCVSRLGYSSVNFSSTLEFEYGFEPSCVLCAGGANARYYDGYARFDGPTDFGTLNLPVGLITPPNCRMARGVLLSGANAYTSPVIATATDQCGLGLPNIDLKPIHAVEVFCQVIRGVAYGICAVTVSHIGTGTTWFTRLRYRLAMGSDCNIPLGVYSHFETVHDPADTQSCSQAQCTAGCPFNLPSIWDISPGTVTIA